MKVFNTIEEAGLSVLKENWKRDGSINILIPKAIMEKKPTKIKKKHV